MQFIQLRGCQKILCTTGSVGKVVASHTGGPKFSVSRTHVEEPGMVWHVSIPSAAEAETGKSIRTLWPRLLGEFQATEHSRFKQNKTYIALRNNREGCSLPYRHIFLRECAPSPTSMKTFCRSFILDFPGTCTMISQSFHFQHCACVSVSMYNPVVTTESQKRTWGPLELEVLRGLA